MKRPMRVMLMLAMLIAALPLAGCGSTGQLSMRSAVGDPVQLSGNFNKVIYGYDDRNTLNILLIEGGDEQPSQVVHVEMRWTPRAGRTPIDEMSTNAVVRYVIFTGESAGVYSGAGFLFPQDTPGGATFRGALRNSSLRLQDHSENFHDRLGLAQVTGGFSAARDDAQTQAMLLRVQRLLRQQIGYPTFVRADSQAIAAR